MDVGFTISSALMSNTLTSTARNIAWDSYEATLATDFTAAAAGSVLGYAGAVATKPAIIMATAYAGAGLAFGSEASQTTRSQENAAALRATTAEADLLTMFGLVGIHVQDDFGNSQLTLSSTTATQPALDFYNSVTGKNLETADLIDGLADAKGEVANFSQLERNRLLDIGTREISRYQPHAWGENQ